MVGTHGDFYVIFALLGQGLIIYLAFGMIDTLKKLDELT